MRRFSLSALLALLLATSGQAHAVPATVPCQFASHVGLVLAAANADLGCSTSDPFLTAASEQHFEHGSMLWLQEWGIIDVLREDGGYDGFDDHYTPDKPESAGLTPPTPDLLEPLQGFGAIWRTLDGPSATLGWATGSEASYVATVQYFERGAVIQREDGSLLALSTYNHAHGHWALTTPPPAPDR